MQEIFNIAAVIGITILLALLGYLIYTLTPYFERIALINELKYACNIEDMLMYPKGANQLGKALPIINPIKVAEDCYYITVTHTGFPSLYISYFTNEWLDIGTSHNFYFCSNLEKLSNQGLGRTMFKRSEIIAITKKVLRELNGLNHPDEYDFNAWGATKNE